MCKDVITFDDRWNRLSLDHSGMLKFKVLGSLGQRLRDKQLMERDQVFFIVMDARVFLHLYDWLILRLRLCLLQEIRELDSFGFHLLLASLTHGNHKRWSIINVARVKVHLLFLLMGIDLKHVCELPLSTASDLYLSLLLAVFLVTIQDYSMSE